MAHGHAGKPANGLTDKIDTQQLSFYSSFVPFRSKAFDYNKYFITYQGDKRYETSLECGLDVARGVGLYGVRGPCGRGVVDR